MLDEEIIAQIKEIPELINAKLKTGMNPFVAAVAKGGFLLQRHSAIWGRIFIGHVRHVKAMP